MPRVLTIKQNGILHEFGTRGDIDEQEFIKFSINKKDKYNGGSIQSKGDYEVIKNGVV